MYIPFSCFIYFYLKDRAEGKREMIAIWKFWLCSLIDVHGTQFIVFAYTKTSVTSVMLLEDATIPFAVFLSVICLRVKYKCFPHYLALLFCIAGMACSITNDLVIKNHND